ncbi:conserved protein of unknown function [Bartonella clarridgeiae 73]|uniref:DUF2293 domain-containing protein n=1 Tax=Bartonella clarridgeiae (strain CCUG 45776 / CIP 104772 / 73) TaxID=696125 RepID=E6YIK4_BARC7|nr:DUF2293 domain-containing protein [Bartonella clarridgeiae]WCR54743.1 MAG: hypothetical protein PG977_000136 [Bartonella clarridgeiae]CBI76692.1 conserved protein of unknown function [Bartonella clarridgeiae 73]
MRIRRKRAISKELIALIPQVPYIDSQYICTAATRASMKYLPTSIAVWLATIAHIRHQHTEYDNLLCEGYDRDSALFFVFDAINKTLIEWGANRLLKLEENIDDISIYSIQFQNK